MKATDCRRCGSAGSVEFGMCQVCYHDCSRQDTTSWTGAPLVPCRSGDGSGPMELGLDLLTLVAAGQEAEAATA